MASSRCRHLPFSMPIYLSPDADVRNAIIPFSEASGKVPVGELAQRLHTSVSTPDRDVRQVDAVERVVLDHRVDGHVLEYHLVAFRKRTVERVCADLVARQARRAAEAVYEGI